MQQKQQRMRFFAISVSLAVGLLLLVLKFYIFKITGSSAVLSDAIESIINVVAAAFALASVVMADKPPDEDHPYGHGKIEYFSAGFEGGLIIVAAAGIFWTGIQHLLAPGQIQALGTGLLLLLATGIINFGLGTFLIVVGKRSQSLALIADGRHVITDAYTSAGVLIGLLLVKVTGWYWLDGAFACLIGVHILFSGWRLVAVSFAGLMDSARPEVLEKITDILTAHRRECWIDIHRLRAWSSGNRIHIDFHLIVPMYFSLVQAHEEMHAVEALLQKELGAQTDTLVHVDPCNCEDCVGCLVDGCPDRSGEMQHSNRWRHARLIRNQREE